MHITSFHYISNIAVELKLFKFIQKILLSKRGIDLGHLANLFKHHVFVFVSTGSLRSLLQCTRACTAWTSRKMAPPSPLPPPHRRHLGPPTDVTLWCTTACIAWTSRKMAPSFSPPPQRRHLGQPTAVAFDLDLARHWLPAVFLRLPGPEEQNRLLLEVAPLAPVTWHQETVLASAHFTEAPEGKFKV
jgi:hypothetical protein